MRYAAIKDVCSFFPEKIEKNDLTTRIAKKLGIIQRHIVQTDECASDLAYDAARKLFAMHPGLLKTCDFLLFCTQSPDYFLPTTSCILQDRLGLPTTCGALDFNLGCSGFVYGLGLAKGLIESNQAENVLLITAETYSKFINEKDLTVKPLFGDGAAATWIGSVECQEPYIQAIVYGTDGSGFNKLIVPVGGMRQPFKNNCSNLSIESEDEFGNRRGQHNLYMDGAGIYQFALDVVPAAVELVLHKANLTISEIDLFIFHQANKFMLESLRSALNIPEEKFINDCTLTGNTVSASIPNAINQMGITSDKLNRVMVVGFGVGLSWAAAIVNLSEMSNQK